MAVPRDRHRDSSKAGEDTEETDETVVFITNKTLRDRRVKSTASRYRRRWGIENNYKTIKEFLVQTTSKTYVVRLSYFAFACLLYSLWRLVDLLVQLDLFEEYDRSPLVTANDVLTLTKQRTGIG